MIEIVERVEFLEEKINHFVMFSFTTFPVP